MSQNRNTQVIFSSEARTADPATRVFTNKFNRGGQIIIDMTAVTATGSVTFNVEALDQQTGKWYEILVSAAITAVSTVALYIGPGNATVANVESPRSIPRFYRVRPVHLNAVAMTYSVSANLTV